MSEQELVIQHEADQPAPVSQMELGSALRISPKGGSTRVKKPRFALTPAKFIDAAMHCWKLAVPAGLILAAAGFGIAWATYAPKYTAIASMHMQSNDRRLLPQNEDRIANHEDEFRKTQAFLVKSRSVLEAVLKNDEVRALPTIRKSNDPVLWLEKELQAGFVKDTSIFRLSLAGEEPEDLKTIVNETMRVFTDQHVLATQNEKESRYKAISRAVDLAVEKVNQKRQKYNTLAKSLRTRDSQTLTLKQRAMLEEYAILRTSLLKLEQDIRDVEAFVAVIEGHLMPQNAEIPQKAEPQKADLPKADDSQNAEASSLNARINEYLERHPTILKLRSEISGLQARIEDYKNIVTGSNPRLAQFQEELRSAEARLSKAKADLQSEAVETAKNEVKRQRFMARDRAKEKIEVLKKQHESVLAEVVKLNSQADEIGLNAIELEEFREQIAETDIILKRLRAEQERMDLEKSNNLPTVSAFSPAIAPTVNQASFPTSAALYSVLGFLLGFLGVSFFEARTCRVHKAAEVQRDLGIETLAAVPVYGDNRLRKYGRASSRQTAVSADIFSEAVNGLCVTILCDDRLSAKSTLMITSATEGEGKTLLATQVCAGFARAGRKTLLMDCDFRHPRCHEQAGLAAGPGISEILRGECEVGDALQTLPNSDSHFLSAGVYDRQVIHSLNNGIFAALLAQLRNDYDCIIVDSAPTLVVPDGLMIGKMVDGVILVVRSKVSKAHSVFAVHEQLRGLRIPILGAVLNGSQPHASGYYAK